MTLSPHGSCRRIPDGPHHHVVGGDSDGPDGPVAVAIAIAVAAAGTVIGVAAPFPAAPPRARRGIAASARKGAARLGPARLRGLVRHDSRAF